MTKGADVLSELANNRQNAKPPKIVERPGTKTSKEENVKAENSQNVRLSITGFDSSLKRRLKHYAVEHDISLSTIVQTAVNEFLERNA